MIFSRFFKFVILSSVVGAPLLASQAVAETLDQALVAAFQGNPSLRADRARQRGTDEGVPQALAGWRPTINANGSAGYQNSGVSPGGSFTTNPTSLSITLSQPIFRGFATVEGTAAAEATVKAGRQQLLATEESVLFSAVEAYMNVVRDRELLSIRQSNVAILRKQLKAAKDRFSAGVITKTDVAQAQASLDGAVGAVAGQRAQLQASEANYVQIIGHAPGRLGYGGAARVPVSLDAALDAAQEINPNILAAAQLEDASEHQVGVVKAGLLPTVSVQASQTWSGQPSSAVNSASTSLIQGVVSVPIYEGGKVYSGVRQAQETVSQNKLKVIGAVRSVREGVVDAWNSLASSGQSIASARSQVAASRLALNGVEQEYQVGSRSTIDVLNAEAALLTAQLTLATAVHDRMVASYQVLSAIGQLTADHLRLGVSYDPRLHYDSVRNKWIGFDSTNPDPVK